MSSGFGGKPSRARKERKAFRRERLTRKGRRRAAARKAARTKFEKKKLRKVCEVEKLMKEGKSVFEIAETLNEPLRTIQRLAEFVQRVVERFTPKPRAKVQAEFEAIAASVIERLKALGIIPK